jgi:hypothetical protein
MKNSTYLPFLALAAFLPAACGGADAPDAAASDAPAALAMADDAQAPGCWLARGTAQEAGERASPLDSASVTLGGQEAKVCYGAPYRNDRVIMGGLVPWDEPWRLGANETTALHLTFPARVAGIELQPGSYSLYAVPTQHHWEIVVNGDPERWGIPIDEGVRGQDIDSATVMPETTDQMVERMVLRFDRVSDSEAHLVMEWENTRVRIPVVRTGE